MKSKTNTTADLIVKHIHKHLTREVKATPQFPKLNFKGLKQFQVSSTALFALAGIVILTVAFQLVKLSYNVENPVFIAEDATDYTAQTAFYTSETGETLHSAADYTAAQEVVASAAQAAELSQVFNLLGALLVIALFVHLHQEYGLFSSIHPHFRIRRIH